MRIKGAVKTFTLYIYMPSLLQKLGNFSAPFLAAILCMFFLSLPGLAQALPADNGSTTTAATMDKLEFKHVLFLNSYSRDFYTIPIVTANVEKELKDIAVIQYVFMNTKNREHDFAFEQTRRELEYLEQQRSHFDLIIVSDDDAFDFVQQYREQYFKDIPVVFEGVNSEEKVRETLRKDSLLTGVVETYQTKDTLDLAVKLRPKATRLVIISDRSVSAQGTDAQLFALAHHYPQLTFEILNTTEYSTGNLAHKLSLYGSETILVSGVFSIDGSDRHYTIPDGTRFLSSYARIPIFKTEETGVGNGFLGGYVLSFESVGKITGQMARQLLLNKASTAALGYVHADSEYVFDTRVMDRFMISKKDLPVQALGARFLNEEPSFYDKHSYVVWGFTALILVIVIIGLMNDRKQNQLFNEKLAAQQAEIKASALANAAKTDFLSRMSHDIRTPLNAIIGLADLARDDIHNPERMQDNLHKIHTSGEFLLELLNDVLDMSRIESGKLALQYTPCSLDEFTESMHTIFDNICAQRRQKLTITSTLSGRVVLTDKTRFAQIFANLLNNASKFTPAGGSITLTATCADEKYGELPCTFTVSDTGKGMSPAFQRQMFDAFTQEENHLSTQEKGSGLGLAIVKKITDLMQGTIEVQSAPGKGTTFTLHFNFKTVPVSQVASILRQSANFNLLQGRRILLVEDQALNAHIASRLLAKQGMLVELAENGKLALDKFAASPLYYYDALLMDIRMPVMDGHAATKAIRALYREDARTVPIIAMTADAFDGDVKASLQSGMNAHLNKPIIPEKLYEALLKFMRK